jgi:Ca2+-binding RTX toxin-like protein
VEDLFGESDNDTYIGGRGEDTLRESLIIDEPIPVILSNDEMNGGPSRDFMEGNEGDDILTGQEGSEHLGTTTQPTMFGDEGDDKLFGGPGGDAMQGVEGTDEHYGGDNNDFINAASQEMPPTTDAPDLVDCGSGIDTAVYRRNDRVLPNCEPDERILVTDTTTVAPALVTTNEEQQQQSEDFESVNR